MRIESPQLFYSYIPTGLIGKSAYIWVKLLSLSVKDSKNLGVQNIDDRTRSYKKDDEPLLNLTGAMTPMSRCSRGE